MAVADTGTVADEMERINKKAKQKKGTTKQSKKKERKKEEKFLKATVTSDLPIDQMVL